MDHGDTTTAGPCGEAGAGWAARRRQVVAAWAGLWLATSLLLLVPALPGTFRLVWSHGLHDAVLAVPVLVVTALRWRRGTPSVPVAWREITLALGFFVLAGTWAAATLEGRQPRLVHVAGEDTLYLASYLFWLSALTRDNALERAAGNTAARLRQLEVTGALVLLAALGIYFVLLPAWLEPERYAADGPSLAFYATLDLLLLAGFVRRAAVALTPESRRVSLWLAAAWALWAVLDVTEAAATVCTVGHPLAGAAGSAIWSLPLLGVLLAATGPHPSAPPAGTDLEAVPTPFLGGVGLVTGATVALPTVHLVLRLTGLAPAGSSALATGREWIVLAGLVVLTPLLVFEHATIRRWLVEVGRQRRREREAVLVAQRFQSLGQIAGGIAHEFNNLLQVIRANADLLDLRLAHRPEVRPQVEALVRAVERGADLTGKLLAFSRRQRLEFGMVSLNEIVERQLPVLRRVLGEDIVVRTDLAPDLRPVRADAGQLEQAVLNLVLNARDAMPRGGTLWIRTWNAVLGEEFLAGRPWARTGEFVALAVEDTGHGMPPEVLERAFEPFFTTKPVGSGTGLGLSFVYGLVKQHRGKVDIRSAPGEGTAVTLLLPPADAGPGEGEPDALPAPPREAGVVLVEDDPDVRSGLAEALRARGFDVHEAETAAAALELVERVRPEVLVSDVVMPGGSGIDLAERARALHPGLAVVLVTGHADETLDRHGARAVPHVVLHKPVSADDLAAAVERALARV